MVGYQNEWQKIKQNLSKYSSTWTGTDYKEAVSNKMAQTALLGNGDLGIVSSGNLYEKTYLICKGDFWNCGDMKKDSVEKADSKRVSPLAVGGISVCSQDNTLKIISSEEELSIFNGELKTYIKYEEASFIMTSWISQEENLLITVIENKGNQKAHLKAKVWAHKEIPEFKSESGTVDGQIWFSRKSNNEANTNKKSWTSEVYVQTKILGIKVDTKNIDNYCSELNFNLERDAKVYLITAVGGGGKTYDCHGNLNMEAPSIQAKNMLNNMLSMESIYNNRQKSEEWWEKYWMKSHIEIGDDLIQRYYYGSLYYMGAGTRENKLVPGLYGIWTTTDGAMWNGDYHLNYNMIAPFYGMYSSNRCEFAKALKDPLLDYMEEGKRRSKEDLSLVFPNYISGGPGMKASGEIFAGRKDLREGIEGGILYPVALGPWGSTSWGKDGAYLMQVFNAGFSGLGLTAYYSYTQDAEYIREIYPFLEANINFYLKWCEKEEIEDGRFRYIIWSGAHEGTFDKNASAALGVIKNILQCLLNAVENGHIQASEEKLLKWKDLDEHLADIYLEKWNDGKIFNKVVVPLSEKGVKLEAKQATVNLEFIHPGEQLDFDSSSDLIEAVKNSLEQKELVNQEIWNQINNTPKMYIHAIRAGYNPQYVMDKFMIYLKNMKKNFTIYDGYHGIEKAGAIEFINNMLLQSADGILKVFPVWTKKDASFSCLREKGAYIVSSEMKDGEVKYVDVVSETGKPVVIVSPWDKVRVVDENENTIAFVEGMTKNSEERTIAFKALPGKTYRVVKNNNISRT